MKPCRMSVTADNHMGNPRVDAFYMTKTFYELIEPWFVKSDMAVFNGDFFDLAISMADRAAAPIVSLIAKIHLLCEKNNITTRWVRGTIEHDRIQMLIIKELYDVYNHTFDMRYVDTLSLEYIERFDMRVLYLPDNLPYANSQEVMDAVWEKMREKDWDWVDYAFVHGSFDFAIPKMANPKVLFTPSQFKFVRFQTLCGHIHNGGEEDGVRYTQSSDRLCHNDETAKGFLYLTNDGEVSNIRFVENEKAHIFKTYNYASEPDSEVIIKHLKRELDRLPADRYSFIRIIHPDPHLRRSVINVFKKDYPDVIFSEKAAPTEDTPEVLLMDQVIDDISQLTPPTEEVLPNLIKGYLTTKFGSTDLEEDDIRGLLTQAKVR